jgi:uncharacterized protein YaaR (DUF327 family)
MAGLVNFGPLFGKLSQPASNVGMAAVALSARRFADRMERMQARREATALHRERMKAEQTRFETEQAGIQSRHEASIGSQEASREQARRIAEMEEAGRAGRHEETEARLGDEARAKALRDTISDAVRAQEKREEREAEKLEADRRQAHRIREAKLRAGEMELEAERNELMRKRDEFDQSVEKAKNSPKAMETLFKRRQAISEDLRKHAQNLANYRDTLDLNSPVGKKLWTAQRLRFATELQQTFEDLPDEEVEDAVENMLSQGQALRPSRTADELDPVKEVIAEILRKTLAQRGAVEPRAPASQPSGRGLSDLSK